MASAVYLVFIKKTSKAMDVEGKKSCLLTDGEEERGFHRAGGLRASQIGHVWSVFVD